MASLSDEISSRRTFAIISHPDAGKTTLTEKLLLYTGSIQTAGSVKGKSSAKHAVSDWMDIEKERGISVTSSVLQFTYNGACVNILDTPGHQDFSEDTYRTLMAADAAVMVIDGAKGVEAQTKKLFKVCTLRHIPIFTFVNKLDHEARDPFELMEEIENVLGINTYPMNWPIGSGRNFRGVFDRQTRRVIAFEGDGHANATKKVAEVEAELGDPSMDELIGEENHKNLMDDIELLDGAGDELDLDAVACGKLSPAFFGSALTNFGVEPFLKEFLRLAPTPRAYTDTLTSEPVDPCRDDFSGFVFKIQANMDKNHRDRIAFVRICSGKFERDTEYFHVQSGRKMRLSQPQTMMAAEREIVDEAYRNDRFVFEEVIWLLLFGTQPTREQLEKFNRILSSYRELPEYFAEDMIIKAPSPNIMNKLARSVLALYSYDDNPDDLSMENVLRQSIQLIAMLPTIMGYSYQVKRRHYDRESMYVHPLEPGLSTSETILRTIRADASYTDDEAKLLDLCLMLHAEHGGGNNSTFAARVLSSSGTDTYSAIAAAIGALKGPLHGGANIKVMGMLEAIKAGVQNWENDDEVAAFLEKLIRREAGDRSGKIYGMGHAVYTLSDPRAVILKKYAVDLAEKRGYGPEFRLLETVEKLTPGVFAEVKGSDKAMCANVDMYSGLVYKSLGLHPDLFTPLFAVARMAGWCAHRVEELYTGGRIIRPAYKAIAKPQPYIPLAERG